MYSIKHGIFALEPITSTSWICLLFTMNTIVVCAFLVICAQWVAVANAECKVSYNDRTYYSCCSLGKVFMTQTVEQCLAQCNTHNYRKQPQEYPCWMVNWHKYTGECSLLTSSGNNDQIGHNDYVTGTYYDCQSTGTQVTQPPPPKTVGCGVAAKQYQPSLPTKRIIGGNEAVRHSWPWQISLRTSKPGYDWHFCGGTLLRVRDDLEQSDMVLSAAHCFPSDPKVGLGNISEWTVVLGTHTRPGKVTPGEQRFKVVQYKNHDDYKHPDFPNDVAVVRLERPVQFSDTIRPICLPPQGDPVPTGKVCIASGWGRNHSKETTQQDELKQALTPVHPIEVCRRTWDYQGPAWAYAFMCAGALDASSATCSGDSGGPVVCRGTDGSWSQYGIASYVAPEGCATANKPPVFTRVPTYSNWVRQTVNAMSALAKKP